MTYTLHSGHVLDVLRTLPDESVHTCITSPPYWGLRKYDGEQEQVWGGMDGCEHEWGERMEYDDECESSIAGKTRTTDRYYGEESRRFNGNHQKHAAGSYCLHCGAWRGALGLEPTPELYTQHLVAVFREVRRVLRNDGVLWLNLGDSYISNPGDRTKVGGFQANPSADRASAESSMAMNKHNVGLKPKDLAGIPWRVAFALQADGWWLRSDIIWSKPNPMPESVTDRPTKAHEYIFLLAKSARYYYDAEAIKEPLAYPNETRRPLGSKGAWQMDGREQRGNGGGSSYAGYPSARNRRSVWTVTTQPFKGAHFATWPEKLVEPMVKAGTSEKGVCPTCGKPWVRVLKVIGHTKQRWAKGAAVVDAQWGGVGKTSVIATQEVAVKDTIGWRPSCDCLSDAQAQTQAHSGRFQEVVDYLAQPVPAVVLDPFCGSGTTGAVAVRLGRSFIGIDLSEKYIRELAEPRIQAEVRML